MCIYFYVTVVSDKYDRVIKERFSSMKYITLKQNSIKEVGWKYKLKKEKERNKISDH